jgi:uncharacterized protein HemX
MGKSTEDDFDRLADEPEDPIAGTQELLFAAEEEEEEEDASLDLGEMDLPDLSHAEAAPERSGAGPWLLVVVLVVALGLIVFGFLMPAQSSLVAAQEELEKVRAESAELRDQVSRVTAERDELLEARNALEAEAEERAGEMEKMARDSETREAVDRRWAKGKRKKARMKRRWR